MDELESLLEEFRTKCELPVPEVKRVQDGLIEFIGNLEVQSYYIASGHIPSFPSTTMDIVMLTEVCLLDVELQDKKVLQHTLFFDQLISIDENVTKEGDIEYLSVIFRTASLIGLSLEDQMQNAKRMRKFSNAVRENIIKYKRK